jgi:signal recognition particle receptor subunit beta
VQVIDMPGTGRLRSQLQGEAASSAVLCCVLDGTQVGAQAKEAAGMLFDVLSLEAVERRRPALIVALNKSDQPGCATAQAARRLLAAELQAVRKSRTTLADTAGQTRTGGIGDPQGPDFTFEQLRAPVDFVAVSATQPKLDDFAKLVRGHIH